MHQPKHLLMALAHHYESHPDRVAYWVKTTKWQSFTWKDRWHEVDHLVHGLQFFGLPAGARVAIMLSTRSEWISIDLACMALGLITVAINPGTPQAEIQKIIKKTEARCVFTDSLRAAHHLAQENLIPIGQLIILDPEARYSPFMTWESFLDLRPSAALNLTQLLPKISSNQPTSIILTSGTNGDPRGVLLGHQQILSECADVFSTLACDYRDLTLSYLPYAHVLARVEAWGHVYAGYQIAFAESIDHLSSNLKEVRPTLLMGVPRVFDKIYQRIRGASNVNWLKKKALTWALKQGELRYERQLSPQPQTIQHWLEQRLAEKLVCQNVRNQFGGRLRFAICGGAALSPEISKFFMFLGIPILEGYGLTETTAAVCVSRPYDLEPGTVGKPLGDVEIKIASDGEVLIRSQKVMLGYWEEPELTAQVIKDEYFYTGDIGEWTERGHLRLIDRKKDLIKTANGKYVSPQKLENMLKNSPFIVNAMVFGDDEKFVSALIVPDIGHLEAQAETLNLELDWAGDWINHPSLKKLIRQELAQINQQLASHESIKDFMLTKDDFSVDSGELTSSLKLRRRKIKEQRFPAT